jgi:CspA family cold shock protein
VFIIATTTFFLLDGGHIYVLIYQTSFMARLYSRVGFALGDCFLCRGGDLGLEPQKQLFFKEVIVLAEGTVKWFSDKKGYGFIAQETGQDIFVHYSSIEMPGFKTLSEGETVNFEVEDSDRGPVAKNVKKP